VREAEDKVAQAQAALARARAEGSASPEIDPRARDALLAQKEVEQARAEVASLEKDLAATRLLAPFEGTVVSMQVRPGDPLEAGRPVMTLARPGDPVIRVDLSERDAGRLAVGQKATVKLDGGGDEAPLSGSLVELVEDTTAGRAGLLEVSWPTTPPVLGTTARVAVTLQEKENVLIVPEQALRSAGSRRFVEYLQGGSRRTANVEVGIVADGDAEVLSGLQEGQPVLVRS
jgi:macrolide-specific efflux system membrane fusion protein